MPVDVLWLCGTGFNNHTDRISADFASHLDPARFRFRPVPYPADYGTRIPYTESRTVGRQALIDAIRATSNLVVIGGYSQGAGIAGDLAAEIGAGRLPDVEVLACALIADPLRPFGAGHPGNWLTNGYGISGERRIAGLPAFWAASEGDPITALPAGNPLRSIADLTEWWSLDSPEAARRWGEDLLSKARRGAWQRWWSPQNWRTWFGATSYMCGYLFTGRHTDDYIRLGHCRRLAEHMGRTVTV